jgi:hypothetical protein
LQTFRQDGRPCLRASKPTESAECPPSRPPSCPPSAPLPPRHARSLVLLALTLLLTACAGPAREVNEPPRGFEALFNGHNLDGWCGFIGDFPKRQALNSEEREARQAEADAHMRTHWRVEDGILIFDGGGRSLVTRENFADFELFVDWMIGPGGDSGIYLRGTPQVQIWDNPIGSGGLYNNQKHPSQPMHVADNPAGAWNTFRILMIGENVSVWLNGIQVVDEAPLENYWDRSTPIARTGPIELQSHGSELRFRNIFIRRIEDGR